ncbi:MAG: benzoyl-CoA 2,3-epoxidase subunit BoxB [Planctomycetota bacterium]
MPGIDYSQKIPNNVDLKSDKRLQRALEAWQPDYIDWWRAMGPTDFNENDVYLRTAVSVEKDGWAHFDYVKMPDYRWGIFLEPHASDRKIGFGDHMGEDAWQTVPGEYRNALRRIIVTQADTEPASVEQQRLLGHTAPSLYDLRNLFQVNVEEGRHLWAMVYVLQSYFGRDGREEAEELLERRSGNADHPRILGTFNEPCEDWLSFFCFACYTDRDGKFQLLSLAESGFDPLARTCRFMLTEEAHHMFVGQSGIGRVIQRTCEVMKEYPDADVKEHGAIPLEVIQRYINFWNSSSNDLFGSEISSNASNFFAGGLKGRAYESKLDVDHKALNDVYQLEAWEDGSLSRKEIPLRNAMNEVLRDEYVKDNEKGVEYFNRITKKNGIDFVFTLPNRRFNRSIGIYSEAKFDLAGTPIDEATWNANAEVWLPTEEDRRYVKSLMVPCHEQGKIAGWIAPPAKGIDGQEFQYEYVKL